MELMIQFNKNTWSIGRNGIRKLKTWDWTAMSVAFEQAHARQQIADDKEHSRYSEAHDLMGNLRWTSASKWTGTGWSEVPTNVEDTGKQSYKAS